MKIRKNASIPIKAQCHALIKLIWNTKKAGDKGTSRAYEWLHKNTSIKHFATENEYGRLFIARKALQKEAMRRELLTFEDILSMDDKIL